MNPIEIISYEKVGQFSLGKSQEEIVNQFGEAPKIEVDNIMQCLTEFRNAQQLIYDKIGSQYILNQVICLKDTTPIIQGIDIFSEGLEPLQALDLDFQTSKTYTLFPNLGICAGGFGTKKIPEKRVVIAFHKDKLEFYQDFLIV